MDRYFVSRRTKLQIAMQCILLRKFHFAFLEYIILFMVGIVCSSLSYVIYVVDPINMVVKYVSIHKQREICAIYHSDICHLITLCRIVEARIGKKDPSMRIRRFESKKINCLQCSADLTVIRQTRYSLTKWLKIINTFREFYVVASCSNMSSR